MPSTTKGSILGLCIGAYAATVLASIPSPSTPASPAQPQAPLVAPSTSSATSSKSPQAVAAPVPPPTVKIDPSCVAQNLTAQTWNRLQLDKHLAEYPGGNRLNLADYAASQNAQNFRCGIEEFCSIGQICNPVPAPDWYILLAAQEWNNCMNSVYKAVHYAVTTVQGTLSLMVTGLAEHNLEPHKIVFQVASLSALVGAAAAIFGLVVSGLFMLGYIGILADFALAAGLIAAAGSSLAPGAFMTSDLLRAKPSDKKSFVKWAFVGNTFSQWEMHMQSMIANTTQAVINAPISSPDGISGVVRNGTFLFETQLKSTSDLQIEYETVLQARSLVLVLRAMGAYVTRGSDPCHGTGTNGAWGGDDVLSYCGPDKVMMNIVLAKGDKTVNKIRNARYVSTKFGFTTEYIVNQSWNCQKKYQKFEFDPYRDGPLPSDPNSDCVMNLPVCDLTDQKIDMARHGKHHHTTKACRTQGGLPI